MTEILTLHNNISWAHLNLANKHWPISYINDTPQQLLNLITAYQNLGQNAAQTFDCESWDYTLVLTPDTAYIIIEKDGLELIPLTEKPKDICISIREHLAANLDAWAAFPVHCDTTKEIQNYRKELKHGLEQLMTD